MGKVKYKTIKTSLKRILVNPDDRIHIEDAVNRSHRLVVYALQFLKLYLLQKNKNDDIPKITSDMIKMIFKTLTYKNKSSKRGKQVEGENKKLFEEFKEFDKHTFSKLYVKNNISGENLSGINDNISSMIVTNLETHIKEHYVAIINKYINLYFKNNAAEYGLDKMKAKEFYSNIRPIKNDIITGTLKSPEKYHTWIKDQIGSIIPNDINDDLYIKINHDPQNFLKYLFKIASLVETMDGKLFRVVPLRTDIVPKYIKLETKALIEIIPSLETKLLKEITAKKSEIWNRHFNIINNKKLKVKDYQFDHVITTDGIGVSILFIHNDDIEICNKKKETIKRAKNEVLKDTKKMTSEQKVEYKKTRQNIKEQERTNKIEAAKKEKADKKAKREEIKDNLKKMRQEHKAILASLPKNERKQKKIEFDELEKIEKDKLPIEVKNKLNKAAKNHSMEMKYIEDLTEEELDSIRDKEVLYIDLGKRDLLMIMNNKGDFMNISNKSFMKRTKRSKNRKRLENYKNKEGITKKEHKFKENSNTVDFDKFKKYIYRKNQLNECLYDDYKEEIFRKKKWFNFINRQREYDSIMNRIKERFSKEFYYGRDIVIIYGDWSIGKQMRNFISTPNLTLKRKVVSTFKSYDIDEYNTSKLHHKTDEVCSNLCLPLLDKSNNDGSKKYKLTEMHAILTYKMENGRVGCINRDKNSVQNMKSIVDSVLDGKGRPERFRRTKILNDQNNDNLPAEELQDSSNDVHGMSTVSQPA